MAKHFLVTISNDVENLFGVQFICSFFQAMSDCQITLFHICRLDAPDMKAELLKMWDGPSDGIEGQVSIGARNSLDQAVRMLQDRRMRVDQMITKTVAERGGKVRDILAEGSRGLYDAIVLGRRASYTLQWLVERPADEIAQALIRDHTCSLPLWICPRIDPGRRGVLVCLDGSRHAYRAVDHVGYMLSGQVSQPVTLLQVTAVPNDGDDTVFDQAVDILHRHGIDDQRIERRAVWGLSVASTILSEAEKGGYAAVAVGFGGSGADGEAPSFRLLGGTTSRLICKSEVVSLWCCP